MYRRLISRKAYARKIQTNTTTIGNQTFPKPRNRISEGFSDRAGQRLTSDIAFRNSGAKLARNRVVRSRRLELPQVALLAPQASASTVPPRPHSRRAGCNKQRKLWKASISLYFNQPSMARVRCDTSSGGSPSERHC